MPLVSKFFEADLSEAEADSLEALLASSPGAAERLLALAERDYRATGLPEPRWPQPWRLRRQGAWLLVLLALGSAGYWLQREPPHSVVLAGDAASDFSPAPLPAERKSVEEQRSQAPAPSAPPVEEDSQANPAQRPRLGMQVDGASSGSVRVRVFDAQGACVRHLFEGPVSEGAHHLTWDGKLDGGASAPHGRYTVEVLTAAGASRQVLKL